MGVEGYSFAPGSGAPLLNPKTRKDSCVDRLRNSGDGGLYVGHPATKKSEGPGWSSAPLIYEVQITLAQIAPAIWRRFMVPASITLEQFHEAILAVMGWAGGHFYEFWMHGERYGGPDGSGHSSVAPAAVMTLAQAIHHRQGTLQYVYDWGDEWWHRITLWNDRPWTPGETVPQLLDGRRTCPPEDVGGVWGYEDFLEAVQNPTHPEHATMLNWVGGRWDPEHFDRATLQRRLTVAAQRGGWLLDRNHARLTQSSIRN